MPWFEMVPHVNCFHFLQREQGEDAWETVQYALGYSAQLGDGVRIDASSLVLSCPCLCDGTMQQAS